MKTIFKYSVWLGGFVWFFATCSPLPQQPAAKNYGDFPIQLFLAEEGRVEATFWGMPLSVTAVFPESLGMYAVELHRGSSQVTLPAAMQGNTLTFLVNWESMPARRDSATGFYYDSLFVSTNGSLLSSNVIKVWVRNLAPVVDSVVVNHTKFALKDTIFRYAADTSRLITATVWCRNAKAENIDVAWLSKSYADSLNKVSSSQAQLKTVSYNFIDTLTAIISNNNGAQIRRKIIITRGDPARGPVIDSLSINTVNRYRSADTTVTFYAVSNDTLTVSLFAQGFNPFDSLHYAFTGGIRAIFTQPGGVASKDVRYFYNDSIALDSAVLDTVIVLDQINATISDRSGRSVRRHIVYGLARINPALRPVIDSLRIGSRTIVLDNANPDSIYTYDASIFSTLTVRAYPHKRYSADVLAADWSSSLNNGFSSLSGVDYLQALYTCALSTCDDTVAVSNGPKAFDTLTVAIARLSGAETSAKVLLRKIPKRTNLAPVIDSVRIINAGFNPDDTLCYSALPGTVVTYARAYVLDTMRLRIVIHDPDAGDTSITAAITASGITGLTVPLKTRLNTYTVYTCTYVCRGSAYADTITIRALDKGGATALLKIACPIKLNHPPLIDSVSACKGATCSVLGATDSILVATAGDTLNFSFYGSDSDTDTLVCTWSAKSAAVLGAVNPLKAVPPLSFSALYTCLNSSYSDTITMRLEDRPRRAVTIKRILMSIAP